MNFTKITAKLVRQFKLHIFLTLPPNPNLKRKWALSGALSSMDDYLYDVLTLHIDIAAGEPARGR